MKCQNLEKKGPLEKGLTWGKKEGRARPARVFLREL